MPINFLSFRGVAKGKLGSGVPIIKVDLTVDAKFTSTAVKCYSQEDAGFSGRICFTLFDKK
jgi:hypothetical protein